MKKFKIIFLSSLIMMVICFLSIASNADGYEESRASAKLTRYVRQIV